MKMNVLQIDSAWNTCDYKLRVFVPIESNFDYVLETLIKWFDSAVFFGCNHADGYMMFLADKK